jgi:serine protease AprX
VKQLLLTTSTTAMLSIASLLGPLVPGIGDSLGSVASAVIDDAVLAEGRALVHVADDADLDEVAEAATGTGLVVTSRYHAIGVLHAAGTARDLEQLAAHPDVAWLERDHPIEVFTDSSHTATRGVELLDGEVEDLGIVDGEDIGVAVVDSGVDASHPDLTDRVGENVKVLPGGVAVPFSDTDLLSLSGHGTHVAGIVAGTGIASDGRYHGAATGATIHGVSGGTLVSMHSALDALDWVLANHDAVEPAIRVVNNSWGSSGEHNPDSATSQLVGELVDAGILVVFAAGNSGGDGNSLQTSPECTNPTPGVVCVAAYDDLGSGTRDGATAGFSSRGAADRPETWPDLAAPGASITATCRPVLPLCLTGPSLSEDLLYYATLSGTSMAAPHVAGIAAQVLQVAPDLSPAELEAVLVDTAHDYGDEGHAQGAGLVDAVAAVLAVADAGAEGGDDGEDDQDSEGSEDDEGDEDEELRRTGPPEHANPGGRSGR